MSACRRLDIPVREEPYYLPDLMDADEIIVTSSSNRCLHADQIDGQPAGMKDEKNYEALRSSVLEEFLEQTEC